MRNWLRHVVLSLAWKVDIICHRIIEKLDPYSDKDFHDAINSFINAMMAKKVDN